MQDYGRERTTGFLLKDYYVVFVEPRTKSGDKPLPHLDEKEHKRIFDEHIAQGGNCSRQTIGGLIILRANSFDEARKILTRIPHRLTGLWDHTIHR
jgi:hypothetical protein